MAIVLLLVTYWLISRQRTENAIIATLGEGPAQMRTGAESGGSVVRANSATNQDENRNQDPGLLGNDDRILVEVEIVGDLNNEKAGVELIVASRSSISRLACESHGSGLFSGHIEESFSVIGAFVKMSCGSLRYTRDLPIRNGDKRLRYEVRLGEKKEARARVVVSPADEPTGEAFGGVDITSHDKKIAWFGNIVESNDAGQFRWTFYGEGTAACKVYPLIEGVDIGESEDSEDVLGRILASSSEPSPNRLGGSEQKRLEGVRCVDKERDRGLELWPVPHEKTVEIGMERTVDFGVFRLCGLRQDQILVVGEDGAPRRGVIVYYYCEVRKKMVELGATDDSGATSAWSVESGAWTRLRVRPPFQIVSDDIEPDNVRRIVVRHVLGGNLKTREDTVFSVVSRDGRPVIGAICDAAGEIAISDSGGLVRLNLSGRMKDLRVVFKHANFRERALDLGPRSPKYHRVVMDVRDGARVKFVDDSGLLMDTIEVIPFSRKIDQGNGRQYLDTDANRDTWTAVDGVFVFGLSSGMSWFVVVRGRGYAVIDVDSLSLEVENMVKLEGLARVTLRVRSEPNVGSVIVYSVPLGVPFETRFALRKRWLAIDRVAVSADGLATISTPRNGGKVVVMSESGVGEAVRYASIEGFPAEVHLASRGVRLNGLPSNLLPLRAEWRCLELELRASGVKSVSTAQGEVVILPFQGDYALRLVSMAEDGGSNVERIVSAPALGIADIR
jgi:hypothetical protein